MSLATRNLHSLPSYYGYLVAVWAGIPALTLFIIWTIASTPIITNLTLAHLPPELQNQSADRMGTMTNQIRTLVESGADTATDPVMKDT